MWFKKRPKNRRFERDHILDVKVQSRQLRTMRLRLVGGIVARLLGIATVGFLLWRGSDWFLDEFVFRNAAFSVQEVDIQTDGILPQPQLRACAGVRIGDNLLALDLARIQRDLESLPWIESAAVERVRPHTLKIRVSEREPIAQTTLFEPVGVDGRSRAVVFYLDAEGYVMLPLEAHRVDATTYGFDNLPNLTGIAGVDLHPGRRVDSPQIEAALKLVKGFSHSAMLGLVDLISIDLSVPQLLQASTGQTGVITFGIDNLELQLRRWRLVHDYAARNGKGLATLDLSVSNNVPARWLEASVTPLPKPKLVKPSPYRKKHV
jgi:hypothetical protein